MRVLLNFINYSVKRRNLLFSLFMVLLPMTVTGVIFFFSMYQIMAESINKEIKEYNAKANELFYLQLQNIDNTYYNIINNKTIYNYIENYLDLLDSEDTPGWKFIELKSRITQTMIQFVLFDYAWDNKLIDSIFIFLQNGDRFEVTRRQLNINKEQELSYVMEKVNSGPRNAIVCYDDYPESIYFTKGFYSRKNNKYIGSVVIQLNRKKFEEVFERILNYEGSIAIMFNSEGELLFSSRTDLSKDETHEIYANANYSDKLDYIKFKGRSYLSGARKIEAFGLSSIIYIPRKVIYDTIRQKIFNYILIISVITILSVFISLFFSSMSTRYLFDIAKSVEKISAGDYGTLLREYTEVELNKISKAFNTMSLRINYLINEVYKKQLLVKEAQLRALQAQINPHFLLNTLMCIAMKSKECGSEPIYNMTISLCKLLKSNIFTNSISDKVTIAEELENVKIYLYLQNQRFEDKIRYNVYLENEMLNECLLPSLCLQPVVENSVVHGFESKDGPYNLSIYITSKDDSVYIVVEDDGVGFDVDSQKYRQPDDNTSDGGPHGSVGISNTDQRIKLLYGEVYGLSVESRRGVGTKVTIHIPIDKRKTANV